MEQLQHDNKYLVNPQTTSRKRSFEKFSESPQPIVSLTSEVDISKLLDYSRQTGYKFNALMCYYILNASKSIPEFYFFIKNTYKNGKEIRQLYKYDNLCVNIVVKGDDNNTYLCDVPFNKNLDEFLAQYVLRTTKCKTEHVDLLCDELSRIATSVLPTIKLINLHNQYSGVFNNPFMAWGKYNENGTLPISFNFHHLQMDGLHIEKFFNNFQCQINKLTYTNDIGYECN